MNKITGLKVVLAMICIYHVVLGLATFVSGDLTVKLAKTIFGLNLEMTPQMSYIVQLLGVYAIVFGVVAGMAALDPLKHPVLLNVIVLLYALRIMNKLLSMNQFQQAFGASMTKVWTDIVLLAAFGVAVVALRPGRSMSSA